MRISFERIENGGMILAVLAITAMMVIITTNTIGRYFFNDSITWAIPVIELYVFGAIIFFSAGKIQRIGGNVSTTAFVSYMSTDTRRYALIIAYLFTEIFLLGIIWGSSNTAINKWLSSAKTASIVKLPTAYSWFIVSIGLTILFFRILFEIYHLFTADDPFDEGEEGLSGDELLTGDM